MPRFTLNDHSITTDLPSERIELLGQGWTEETAEAQQEKTVAELKDELKALGLPTGGAKADLVARLAEGVPAETEPADNLEEVDGTAPLDGTNS